MCVSTGPPVDVCVHGPPVDVCAHGPPVDGCVHGPPMDVCVCCGQVTLQLLMLC